MIDPTHLWPTTGYRCTGCQKYHQKLGCPFTQCPVAENLSRLNPTLTTSEVAKIIGVSRNTINLAIRDHPEVYMAGVPQIPQHLINCEPLKDIHKGKRRKL